MSLLSLALLTLAVAAAKPSHYDVLGVAKTATPPEIKAAYRKLAKELRPDVATDPAVIEKFHRVKEAYDVLADDQNRAWYDRGETRPNPTARTSPVREDQMDEFKRYFEIGARGIPMKNPAEVMAPPQFYVSANLEKLSRADVLGRTQEYRRWVWSLQRVSDVHRADLGRVSTHAFALVGGAAMSGRNAHGLARFGYLVGLAYLIGPYDVRSAVDGALFIGLSPLAWQAVGMCLAIPAQILTDRCLNTIATNVLAAPSASRLVNAAVAHDFLDGVVARHVKFPGPARRTKLLRREVKFKLAKTHAALLEGWLLRELQKPDDEFLSDVKARPGAWIGPLESLIEDLGPEAELKDRAHALLGALKSQSRASSVARASRMRWDWACELALSNVRAFTRAREDWTAE